MNERIKELAKQAGCKVMDDGEWYIPTAKGLEKIVYTSGVGLEKFAELIVKECAQRCEDIAIKHQVEETTYAAGRKAGAFECASDLKEHFGVEE